MRALPIVLLALSLPVLGSGPVPVVTASGVEVRHDLRSEYLAGFPLLVDFSVTNPSASPREFPDLSARPYLVRFGLNGPKGKSERYSTPPEFEVATSWTLSPGAERSALIEIPSSGAFPPGAWEISPRILVPDGDVKFPTHTATIAPARPASGSVLFEPTVATNTGAVFPWFHQASRGFDLYLMHFDPTAPAKVRGQYALAHTETQGDPILARARPGEALARHVYWIGGNQLTMGLLNGPRFDDPPRTFGLPFPRVEPLGRGATDARGTLLAPVWIPAPTGSGGEVRAWTIDRRGGQIVREIGRYGTRPTVHASAVDAGANLLVALAHAGGVDLFRVEAATPAEIPARGVRVVPAAAGWRAAALAFDVLPEAEDRPGGLSLLTVLLSNPGETTPQYRAVWTDLNGKIRSDSGPLPWAMKGDVVDLLPRAAAPFYVLTRDRDGAYWHGPQGGTARPAPGNGTLWLSGAEVLLRTFGGPRVTQDTVLGPVPL